MSVPGSEKVPIVEVTDIEKATGQYDNAQSPMSPRFQKLHEEDMVQAPSIHVQVALHYSNAVYYRKLSAAFVRCVLFRA